LEYEVTNIKRTGFWMLVDGIEYFVSFDEFPGFKGASIEQILNVKRLDPEQFRWPDLDIDIDIGSLQSPEKYQKVFK